MQWGPTCYGVFAVQENSHLMAHGNRAREENLNFQEHTRNRCSFGHSLLIKQASRSDREVNSKEEEETCQPLLPPAIRPPICVCLPNCFKIGRSVLQCKCHPRYRELAQEFAVAASRQHQAPWPDVADPMLAASFLPRLYEGPLRAVRTRRSVPPHGRRNIHPL